MQMNIATKATRQARTIAIAALALGAAMMALPTAAEASSQVQAVSQRLDQIERTVESVRDINSQKRQGQVIDALQKKLYRLDQVNDDQRGRLARVNQARIDRLQARLHRMERRVGYRDDRQDYRRDERRSDNRDERWNSAWSRQSYSK